MIEHWKSAIGYPSYEVSDLGRIRSLHRLGRPTKDRQERTIKQRPDKDGYSIISLCENGQETTKRVHFLVALTFVGPFPSLLHEVNHKNFKKEDNRAANLEWLTREENTRHAIAHGRIVQILNQAAVTEIRTRAANGETHRSLAAKFNVCNQHISRIVRGTRRQFNSAS